MMRKMVETFSTGNLSDADSIIAKGYVDHQGLSADTEIAGSLGFRQVVIMARSAYSNLLVEIRDLISEGDRVAVRLRWRGVAAGRQVDRETIDIVRFKQGQAVEHWGARLWISESSDSGVDSPN